MFILTKGLMMIRLQEQFFNTTISIELYDDSIHAKNLIIDLIKEIEHLQHLFNIFEKDSQLTKLNDGTLSMVDPHLYQIIKFSVDYYQQTNHFFNPCCFNLKQAINDDFGNPLLIEFQNNSTLNLHEQKIDLGAIAKGYALDLLKAYIDQSEITDALINFGGSVFLKGLYKQKILFNVGICHPQDNQQKIAQVNQISNCFINTSVRFDQTIIKDNEHYPHIYSHQNLTGKKSVDSITLLGDNATQLDAFCTAISAMELDAAIAFIQQFPTLQFILISDLTVYTNLKNEFQLLDKKYNLEVLL